MPFCPHTHLIYLWVQRSVPAVYLIWAFCADNREFCCSGETNGSVRGVWGIPHRRRRAVSCGWPPDGQATHGLRQDQIHRRGAEGKKKITWPKTPVPVDLFEAILNFCRSCLGETTTALRRQTRRKPGCPEGQRRPRAGKGGTGEEAQRGGREGKGAGKGTREGAWEGTREGERQGTGPRKRKEGTPKPLKQPPLQSDFRQEEEQIPWSSEIQKQRQGQREGAQTQQVRMILTFTQQECSGQRSHDLDASASVYNEEPTWNLLVLCCLILLLYFLNRSRDRERDRERRRSRERSDRKRRSRSRDRKRSRSSERKSHRHRSRSRERDKDKERNQDKDRERDREQSSKDKGEDTLTKCWNGSRTTSVFQT